MPFEARIVGRYTQERGIARKSHRGFGGVVYEFVAIWSGLAVIEDVAPLRAQFDFVVAA